MPRARSWCSTMAFRSRNALKRPRIRGRRDTEVREYCGHHIDDARRRGVDAYREQRHDGVALRERAVTAAAGVVPTAEVGELPAGRGGDEELAGVRIRKGRPRTVQCIGMVEKRRVAARLPTLGALT